MGLAERRGGARTGLLLIVALVSAGWLRQRGDVVAAGPVCPRVMVVGVRGMSWQTLLDRSAAGRLPRLTALIEGVSSGADIVSSPGFDDPAAVLASIVTGRLPGKHRIGSFDQASLFRRAPRSGRVPVWELLSRRGAPVGVVGHPFWAPIAREGSQVVPDWATLSVDRRIYVAGRAVPLPRDWQRLVLRPEDVPAGLVERVFAEGEATPALADGVRQALAADLTMTALADRIYRETPEAHVFLYLEGLERLADRLRGADPALARTMLDGYHETVELLLERLNALDDGATTFLLFSEEGNRGGAIDYRPRLPPYKRWPPIGWLIAWGSEIKRGIDPLTVAPVDLASTLLYLTGNPVPNDLDGTILLGLLHDDFYHKHPVLFVPAS